MRSPSVTLWDDEAPFPRRRDDKHSFRLQLGDEVIDEPVEPHKSFDTVQPDEPLARLTGYSIAASALARVGGLFVAIQSLLQSLVPSAQNFGRKDKSCRTEKTAEIFALAPAYLGRA